MIKKLALGFGVLAMTLASAQTFHVTLLQATVLNGTPLKAGDYSVKVDSGKATFQRGKDTAESPVKVETEMRKYPSTIFKYTTEGSGTMHLTEIRLAGTNTKLVFGQN
ncbi:MAG TPA: hypothetical protein VHD76_20295 [Bryobacteraceae bacterium]|jgi:hypothetical protein|nr:hypothetical protein [Bryobacteraceae bacterium]